MRRLRARIAPDARAASEKQAAEKLSRLVSDMGGRVVAMYAATTDELGTAAADEQLRDLGLAVAYPRVVRHDRRLVFHRVDDLSSLRPGALGILEPPDSLPLVPVERIDLFVVPGLAFDALGNRLGWGQGYYDRILTQSERATRIGYAYEAQIVNHTPRTERDVPMDHIVSEIGILDCHPHAVAGQVR